MDPDPDSLFGSATLLPEMVGTASIFYVHCWEPAPLPGGGALHREELCVQRDEMCIESLALIRWNCRGIHLHCQWLHCGHKCAFLSTVISVDVQGVSLSTWAVRTWGCTPYTICCVDVQNVSLSYCKQVNLQGERAGCIPVPLRRRQCSRAECKCWNVGLWNEKMPSSITVS